MRKLHITSHMARSISIFSFFFNSAGEWYTLVGLIEQRIITSFSEQKLNAGFEYISFRKLHTLFANTICLDTPTWFLQYFPQYRTRCKTNGLLCYKHNWEIFYFILLCRNVNIQYRLYRMNKKGNCPKMQMHAANGRVARGQNPLVVKIKGKTF
jgi:hypothetical protein